ncbi:MAG: DUF1538 domain-containing protein [Lachnospiraceae bacterium]|nr:DUF1538 domain-containing protein [Lachnospiraceae bacterium]
MERQSLLAEKLREAALSVLPIISIVFVLSLILVPVHSGLILSFLIGTVMIIAGMALFSIGADSAMAQIGTHIGSRLTATKKIGLIVLVSFLLGVIITVAEPDLQVLATYVPDIDTTVLIVLVSIGVGVFLVVSMLRILFGIPLRWLLLFFYGLVFILAILSRPDFLSVAFDSGGVTTGPMTVPFIMALGVGVSSIRSDEKAKADSFGLIALCSIGPILAVLVLGFIYDTDTAGETAILIQNLDTSVEVGKTYMEAIPDKLKEVAFALLPIAGFFLLFQMVLLRLEKRTLRSILVGIVFTYLGLVLFLTGANVGFSALGFALGGSMKEQGLLWLSIPLAMVMGWFIIGAEPAVHVLTKQVYELSAGAIKEKTMRITLAAAIAVANGLAILRVLTGLPIFWFVLVGYAIALFLSFVVSPTFTAIAFDAGGVASGPMTAAFMLPFAMGLSDAVGGNIMTDAFGLVALVAVMPLITVQIMGAVTALRNSRIPVHEAPETVDDEVIELWEVV